MSKELVVIGGAGGGGGGGGSARTPVTAPDSLRSVSIIEFVDGLGEGEYEGFATADPLEAVYLQDTPIKTAGVLNFEGVTLDYRLGTQDQTYIPGQAMSSGEDASAAIEFNVGSEVALATPVTRTINSILANAIRVTVQISALWKRNPSTGDVSGHSVELKIEVKPLGGAFFTANLAGREVISGKASSPYERSYHIELGQFGSPPYDIKVSRVSAEVTDGTVSDTLTWKSYTELMYAKLRYPNTAHARLTFDARHFSSIPSRGYLLKGIKVRVPGPAFYDPVLRTYTGTDWDGTFVTAWTRSPPWIFFDIVTDPRYGLGKEVPEEYLDKWNLWTIAQRCDASIADGFGGFEPRYSLDLYLQKDDDAKKVIQDIASNFDAMAFWHRGGIFTAQDAPKPVSALYTPANVIAGRFNYAGSARQVRYTVALVQWNDPDDFYRIATEYVEDTDGIARYGYREKKIIAVGCTSRGQAHREGKRILLTSRLETDSVGFSVGLSGLVNKPGDIVRISDPLKHNDLRLGGRVSAGATQADIPLDAPVTLDAGVSYTLCLVMPDGSVITGAVTNNPGPTQLITTSPSLPNTPDHAAVWSLYSGSVPSVEYRILWINENTGDDDSGFYEVSAVKYDPTKYTLAEDNLQLEPIYQPPFANTNLVIPPTGVVVSDGVYLGLEGVVRYVDVSWTASSDTLLSGHIVKWALDGGEETEKEVTGASYRIENAKEGTYQIEVYALNLAGLVSTSVTVSHVLGILYDIALVSITNLRVQAANNPFTADFSDDFATSPTGPVLNIGNGEFLGKDAVFDWDTDADTVLAFSDAYNIGKGGVNSWYRDYVVKITDTATGLELRTDYVTESAYVYTFEKNQKDNGPRRDFTFEVFARDFYGNVSNNSTLDAFNPPPVNFSSILLSDGLGQIFAEYYPPADGDYQYTRIYASQTRGFTPADANLVFEGSDRVAVWSVPATGNWYVRLQGVDAFGLDGTVYSSEFVINVASVDLAEDVQEILENPGRVGDVVVEADRFIIVQPSTYATPTAVFAVGSVGGVTKVAIRGDLLVDGSINTHALNAGAVTADKMTVTQLSAMAGDMGTLTAGTVKTSPVTTGWRVEVSDVGGFPIWYGTGAKNSTNAKFYLDDLGNAYFSGELAAATGSFAGDMTAGTININSGEFSVDALGNAEMDSVVIKDGSGNTILSSGTGTEWQYVSGLNKPEDGADVTLNNTAAAISGQGAFATLNSITPVNSSTFIANLAVVNAQIGSVDAGKINTGYLAAGRIQAGVAYINEANIGDLQVSTLKIGANAVTIPVSSRIASYGSSSTIISIAITSTGGPHLISAMCAMEGNDGSASVTVFLKRNGVELVQGFAVVNSPELFTFVSSDTPGAGTHTYSLTWTGGDAGHTNKTISVMETKK